ncbi:podosporapepsin precursor, putative [Talaromyces marneffei ATCC 18224]|uniref:Podosporapepsin, putative n=1 Tax=Talaromyces marneffei (strain ATCC 18224 / CBS 334.59 / QM 7333) TaxID=441960 RepID=B6QCX9_TALMQ|nr:podosporapepsin precursor, putative [Talaromyces marneffei ATCC 18224]
MLQIQVSVGILFLAIQSLVRADVAHKHRHGHKVLTQRSNHAYSATMFPITNPGSSVPITVGDAGLIGMIEIGTPGQTVDVRLDTTFNGVMVQSTQERSVIGGGLQFNSSESSSWEYIHNTTIDNAYVQALNGGIMATALGGTDIFNIGGTLYSSIPFGQLYQFDSNQITPFGGASGIIGLNYYPWQQFGLPSFMDAIRDQVTECKCALDSFRVWKNGTWTFGSLDSIENSSNIAWTQRNNNKPTWSINITAISAGSMNNPPISTWSAAVSTEERSLVWPQKLLDWYFTDVDATWSVADNTYRYPCNVTLPDFTFGLGNGTFTIPGSYMLYQRDVTSTTCITIVTGDNSTDSSHEYSFGLGWSQLGVLVLDYENYQVGFMNKSSSLPIFDIPSLEVSL